LPPIRLTALKIKNIKPTARTQRLFDGAGLYLEVSPKGGKWWRYKYRYAGKEKRISLGVYPDITLKEARDRRYQARKLLDDYIDPSEHRQNILAQIRIYAANTFEVTAREWFVQREPGWVASHSSKIIRRLEKDVFPWIGRKVGLFKTLMISIQGPHHAGPRKIDTKITAHSIPLKHLSFFID